MTQWKNCRSGWPKRHSKNQIDALSFLDAHPGIPVDQVLPILNCRCNVLGIVIAAYNSAIANASVREVSFDLLTRQIIQKFPKGWRNGGEVHPVVMISSWDFLFKQCVTDKQLVRYADDVFQSLTIDPLLPRVGNLCTKTIHY